MEEKLLLRLNAKSQFKRRKINDVDGAGNNGVFAAIKLGFTKEDLEAVVKCGLDWRQTNNQGESVLHVAAGNGNGQALQYFISLGADTNAKDNLGSTVLHCTKMLNHNFQETLRLLLEHGLDINAVDKEGNNLLLLCAIRYRSKEQLEQIVAIGGNWRSKNKLGESILHIAAANGDLDVLKHFVSLGADPGAVDKANNTVLHSPRIWRENYTAVIEYLLENIPDINAVNSEGYTILITAAIYGSKDVKLYERFVQLGANWKMTTVQRESMLHLLAAAGKTEALKYFVSIGADLNARDNNGQTVLDHVDFFDSQTKEAIEGLLK